ncbi:MAG TPA: flavin reductase family protein [Longimicrobium sp.]|nr:flavin reductase family protein [Longimicrobium sp.]
MIDESEFRRVIGHFATGVSVVTSCRRDGEACGLTVSAVSSVSLNPTLVLVCVDQKSETHGWLQAAGHFAVNVLEEGHGETLARRFAGGGAEEKFRGTAWRPERTGAPVLDEALAWMDCRVTAALPGGDHTIFIGEVLAADAREGTPLLYYRGGYGRFES